MKQMIDFFRRERWTFLSFLLLVVCALFSGGGVIMADVAVVSPGTPSATGGNAGLETQVPGQATTVSNASEVGGDLIQPDIDEDIFMIGTDETVLDGIMRKAKKKQRVTGYEVDHYMIDEQKASVETTTAYTAAQAAQAEIPVSAGDGDYFQEYGTVLAKGVNGYAEDGKTVMTGTDLMLFIVGKANNGNPILRAVNGPKKNTSDEYCTVPTIPEGTELIFLANACAETQKYVAPDTVVPVPSRVYLQKMIMNQLVSNYFAAQKKRIPFAEATIAEALVKQFRRKSNRTLWVGRKSRFKVDRGQMGKQFVYTTEGIRWQIKREFELASGITFNDIINLAKLKFTGQNCSKEAWWLMGRDLLADIQKIDFTLHKDITMTSSETWGFACTKLHTVFGDFFLKHEPTLDYLGYSSCGAILDMQGLVRYFIKNEEGSEDDVEGEEAKRKCIISINALALKGFSHIWVNGAGVASDIPGATKIINWDNATNAPTSPEPNDIILLVQACAAISGSKAGEPYQWNGTKWVKYTGVIYGTEA